MNQTKTLLLVLAVFGALKATAQPPSRFDVVITEIMADPSPVVGLPDAEYIELKNVSATALSLTGWKISNRSTTATITSNFILQPDSLVVLCASSQVSSLSAFGRTIGVSSFPSLVNDGDVLTLRSPQNSVIHAVAYNIDWYGNESKKQGGWSLEMIDPHNPCTGKANWKASVNSSGGTPGKLNSVNRNNTDNTPPQLKSAFAPDSITVVLNFDEPLDSNSAAIAGNYRFSGTGIESARPLPPLFQQVQLLLRTPLAVGTTVTLTVSDVADCKGNPIGADNKVETGLPQQPLVTDVVVNEILFNPRPGGSDYVEIFNRSKKIIDAANLVLANRNNNGLVASPKRISAEPLYLFPGAYLVVTEDKLNLQLQYLVKNADAVVQLSSLPSFPDDKGTVVLQSINGDIIDEVAYNKGWHFGLIDNDEGIALERINPGDSSQRKSNWHSAASTAGFGTPGYQNSQFKIANDLTAIIGVSPAVFSPDNDGRDDLATISYQTEERGYVANVFIFDAGGKLVRQLVKNDLLALKGRWTWDGLGENNHKLPVGTYIVFTEIFNLEGKKRSFKNTIVLARQLN